MAEPGLPAAELVAAHLDVDAAAVRASAALLCAAERERAGRFARERDRGRFIEARAGLRRLLGARLGVRPEAIAFAYGPHGKPALDRSLAASRLRFNVSHRDGLAVYTFAVGREVGVDVEAVRAFADADRVAARVFSPRENEAYRALGPADRPLGFFNCWTRKEAFVKAVGVGLSHRLAAFDVSLAPGGEARILRVDETPGDECGWRLVSFSPAPGFVAAVVTEVA